ncbi:MAG: M42 family metallopeptidase [Clostridia bacterium]|nr:M42 family metallopeptidase [Clostridia bacterium]
MQPAERILENLKILSAIPSPTGMTGACADAVCSMLAGMGFRPEKTRKGAVHCRLAEGEHPILLCAHLDTLGMAVRAVKPNGRLRYSKIGGWNDNAVENENVVIHTRSGKTFTGTVQSVHASRHVWGDITAEARTDESLEIVLDEDVNTKAETEALGIRAGDMVSFDPRLVHTESGYVKCRFLDDKASAAVLLTLAADIAEGRLVPARGVTVAFTVYEEIGHGASDLYAQDAEDIVAIDMGCVGSDLNCRETQLSICAKDAAGPYDWDLTNELIARADRLGLDYAVDVYPNYSSDANTALKGGLDARFACFGPGVFASHGYERTHEKALESTLRLAEDLAGVNPAE